MPVIAIAVIVLILGSAIGLTIYGGLAEPVTKHYEQVVPDDHLPH